MLGLNSSSKEYHRDIFVISSVVMHFHSKNGHLNAMEKDSGNCESSQEMNHIRIVITTPFLGSEIRFSLLLF